MRLMIIRHGDPDYENDGLLDTGKIEAELLAKSLKNEDINEIFVSPLGRARATCSYTEKEKGMTATIKPWLTEFNYRVDLPTGEKNHLIWDMMPAYWTYVPEFFDNEKWLDLPFIKNSEVPEKYEEVCKGIDEILAKNGYVRNGKTYKVVNENRNTVVLFCHFGVETVILSHLFNIPPMIISHYFVALPSAVTTLYTEERQEGVASFRCCGFGEVSHLKSAGIKPSFKARFCETYHSDERH